MEDVRLVYSEVLGVILALGNKYMENTPSHIIKFLRKNCDYSRIPEIDNNIRLEDQNISEDSKLFIMLLKFNYWCESQSEKDEMYSIMKENEIKYQKELKEKYNIDNLFKNKEESFISNKANENVECQAIAKPINNRWYKKIIQFIKKIFGK